MSGLPKIGYAGMSHLGINSLAAAAARGFEVLGFDPDPALSGALSEGHLPVSEPGLADSIQVHGEKIHFSSDLADLGACDVVYISFDVPTDDQGHSDLTPIEALIAAVSPALRADCVLVVLSQVPPGFTRGLNRHGSGPFYQVETLVFGRAYDRALNPERFIIGGADPSQPLPAALATFLESFHCPILPMRYESAELAKISINLCLVASVTTANTLAALCERIGADWSEIVPALKLDARIGEYAYLGAGLGLSGGNLERDLATLVRFGDAQGADMGAVRAAQANSAQRRYWALDRLHETVLHRADAPMIAVLGLAYKESTHSTKNSPALALLDALRPFPVRAFDPLVTAEGGWHPLLTQTATAMDACAGADAVVVMTPWPEFRALSPAELTASMRGDVVIDPYGMLDSTAAVAAGLRHFRLGAG